MSEINSINVSISVQEAISQASFGKPLILGVSERGEVLEREVLSGNAGLKWKALQVAPPFIQIEYINPGVSSSPLSVSRSGTGTEVNPYLITVSLETDMLGAVSSAADAIRLAAESEADIAGISGIVSVSLLGNGGETVTTFPASPFVPGVSPEEDYLEITDADQLLNMGYLVTDPEYLMAQSLFSQSPKVAVAAVYQLPTWNDAAAKLAELRNSGRDDWYWVLATTRNKAEILPVASYVNSLKKMGVFATSDQTIADDSTGAPPTQERCVYLVSNHAEEFPDAAWVGKCAPISIGSINWDSKVLSGQKNSDVTMAEQSALFSANMNLLREMGGKVVTWEGKTRSGQYIDIVNGRDYLEAKILEAWYFLKLNNSKLDMTAGGLGKVESALREAFRDCGRNGIIAAVASEEDRTRSDLGDYQYTLTVPSVDDLSTNDRANRKVSGIKGTARVGGGINYLDVSIEMTV